MLSVMPRENAARAQRADAGEGHLAERELAAPTGEHRHRDRADREREDDRVGEVVRRLVDDERQRRSRRASATPAMSCGMRRTHQISRSRSGTGGTRGANEKLSPPASSARLMRGDEHEHEEEQHELHEARSRSGS